MVKPIKCNSCIYFNLTYDFCLELILFMWYYVYDFYYYIITMLKTLSTINIHSIDCCVCTVFHCFFFIRSAFFLMEANKFHIIFANIRQNDEEEGEKKKKWKWQRKKDGEKKQHSTTEKIYFLPFAFHHLWHSVFS